MFWVAVLTVVSTKMVKSVPYVPVPFAEGSVFSNTTGRYVALVSAPSLGALKGSRPVTFVAGSLQLGAASSECIWGTYESILFIGPPPSACRNGKRLDGLAVNGVAQLNVTRTDAIDVVVNYPIKVKGKGGDSVSSIGPFKLCEPSENTLGEYNCEAEKFTAVEIYGNFSSVWLVNELFVSQSPLFQFMGLVQAVLFASIAARGKHNVMITIPPVLVLAADAAVGGSFTVAVVLASGRSLVGLDGEFGEELAKSIEAVVAGFCIALSVTAWMHTAAYEMHSFMPHFLAAWSLPFRAALRELCEIPLLISMTVIWPQSAGPHFLIQLQFMCSLAVCFVAGRGSGLLVSNKFYYSNRLACAGAAFMIIGGIGTGTTLAVSTVAASGAINRGGASFIFTLVLQIHVCAAGFFFGAASRIKDMQEAKSSQRALLQ